MSVDLLRSDEPATRSLRQMRLALLLDMTMSGLKARESLREEIEVAIHDAICDCGLVRDPSIPVWPYLHRDAIMATHEAITAVYLGVARRVAWQRTREIADCLAEP